MRFHIAVMFAMLCPLLAPAHAQSIRPPEGLDAASIQRLSIQPLDVPRHAGEPIMAAIEIGGHEYTIMAGLASIRSADFTVVIVGADGKAREVDAPEIRTYRGVLDAPGTWFAGSIGPNGLTGVARLPSGELWSIQPATTLFVGARAGDHVVYPWRSVQIEGVRCAATGARIELDGHVSDGRDRASCVHEAEIAFDADREYFALNGNSTANTVWDIEDILNSTSAIYEREVQIRYALTRVVIRTAEPDPYDSTEPATLAGQVRSAWNAVHDTEMSRDMLHLMTGKNIDDNWIGYAYIGAVCDLDRAYGFSQSHFTSVYAGRVALTAHELGHNWSAVHCDGDQDCAIMCSVIGDCSGQLDRFGDASRSAIEQFRDSVADDCLVEWGGSGNARWYFSVTTDDGDSNVESGEYAHIELWVEMSPDPPIGFAGSLYDILGGSNWNLGEVLSYTSLIDSFGTGDGVLYGNGDIRNIEAFQLPPLFNPDFVADNPVRVYLLDWKPVDISSGTVSVRTTNHLNMDVYVDVFGGNVPYCVDPAIGQFTVNQPPPCDGDFNGDGVANTLDVLAFLNAWSACQ